MKRIALVGHCGPDSSYLVMAARRAAPEAAVERVDDEQALKAFVEAGGCVLLVNRVLDGEFADQNGIELIRRVNDDPVARGRVRSLLVSNYPDAQVSAEQAGAMPGFGKRDIGSERVSAAIQAALGAVGV
jgi:hypothetical protein